MNACQRDSRTPTISPADIFCPIEDSKALRNALKGLAPDKKTVIQIITSRSNAQRLRIIDAFDLLYKKDLVKKFKCELWRDFEDIIVALMTETMIFQTKQLHRALTALISDDMTIIEILSVHCNEEIRSIKRHYRKFYNQSLEETVVSNTSGLSRDLFLSLLKCERDESTNTCRKAALLDAENLLQTTDGLISLNPEKLVETLCKRNKQQLRLVLDEYEKVTGHSIEHCIRSEFYFSTKHVLLDFVSSIRNIPEFFAEKLYRCMHGPGTCDKTLIRIIVSRSEIDLEDIKLAFKRKYEKSLKEFVEDDTSGDYRKCLLYLIGQEGRKRDNLKLK